METVYAGELYDFLTELAQTAQSHQDEKTIQRINAARKHYIIPSTSEFLGESMLVLQEVLRNSATAFGQGQIDKAREYADAIKRQWFSSR